MLRYLFGAIIIAGLATEVPGLLEQRISKSSTENEASEYQRNTRAVSTHIKRHNPLEGRKARIKLNRHGHFIANARLNGYRSDVLVDTGATAVAVNESTARRMGIRLKSSDFKYKVRTANGITMAAVTMIDEITIGRVVVKNVRATVSKDKALDVILLGMSFLNQLKKYEVDQGTLILTQ